MPRPQPEYDDPSEDYLPGMHRFEEEDQQLVILERRLNEEVDLDFFEEPKTFNTLQRVIDVLGEQMIDDATVQSHGANLEMNPAYQNLKSQQKIVEDAIEHMAVIHCQDLNGSVIQVGRVARQFSDAVGRVRTLRQQVRDIQDTLGQQTGGEHAARGTKAQNAAAMSLRELWLKKLECEATLALLEKLDVIRAAPAKFDQLVQPPCRIGAAILTVTNALQTMFSDDVAQVQALHKIMEQLLIRKQKAEELLWETLQDVLYLRTGNRIAPSPAEKRSKIKDSGSVSKITSGHSISSESRRSGRLRQSRPAQDARSTTPYGTYNPFVSSQIHFATDDNLDDQSVESTGTSASLFSQKDDDQTVASQQQPYEQRQRMLIPIPVIEAELDLEADERRCMEEVALMALASSVHHTSPRYADSVPALRILVESLMLLKRVDDLERVLNENLEKELLSIARREQARTFSRLERKRMNSNIRATSDPTFKEFRRHLSNLLSAYGTVLIRLTHLAEILRFRISSDQEILQKLENPSSIMRSVLNNAQDIMQREIKSFLKTCFYELDEATTRTQTIVAKGQSSFEQGLFSLGIVDAEEKKEEGKISTATRSNIMEMKTSEFVSNVLFARSKNEPGMRNALLFRRTVSKWSSEVWNLQEELAGVTGEDMSSGSFIFFNEERAIDFLDQVIERELLPVLQEEAMNGTVKGLEDRDSFDPVLGGVMYGGRNSFEPHDIDMCKACHCIFDSTSPLFMALNKLPRTGSMYQPVVAVLEHAMATFITRIKQQVQKLTTGKTALDLLMDEKDGKKLSNILERRKPFHLLIRAYSTTDKLENIYEHDRKKSSNIMPLAASMSDTSPHGGANLQADAPVEDVAEDVEEQESILKEEMKFIGQYIDFSDQVQSKITTCTDEEMMRCASFAHSLLKLTSFLEVRVGMKKSGSLGKSPSALRALKESISTIRMNGVKLAKFCRLDMLMQAVTRLSKICKSSTLVATDAVRIPSSVNDLGEYLTGASDNLLEAAGSAVTAYTLSTLEQYIPLCLMETVRVIAAGRGIVTKAPFTMNGVEALDRSGSVLYRDLKGATSFDNSFWDVELAAVSFERSASLITLTELDMEELSTYYMSNKDEFSPEDYMLLFTMTGPRRRGDIGRYHMLNRQ